MSAILRVEELTGGYGSIAVVRDLNMTVNEGEIVALLGPNGAGKTTTLLTISGILKPIAGRIVLGGRPVHSMAPHKVARLGCAHVAEGRALFHGLTVRENLQVAMNASSATRVLQHFPALQRIQERRAGLLSGGEQQMLAIARALGGSPRLLMIDEVSLGLAPIITKSLLEIVRTIASETGCAVLMVEQHVQQALAIADRGYVLNRGQVVMEGSASQLRADRHLVEQAYLGETVKVEA